MRESQKKDLRQSRVAVDHVGARGGWSSGIGASQQVSLLSVLGTKSEAFAQNAPYG